MRVSYRVGQFVRRLTRAPSSDEEARALALLPPEARALYAAMEPGDRLHALCVLRALEAEGWRDPAILQAALLHDAGKARAGLTLLHRSLCVVLARVHPHTLERLAAPAPGTWRYPFYVHLHHAEIGADRCAAAGCAEDVVTLVRLHEHQDGVAGSHLRPALRGALAVLRRADERC